MRLKIVMMNGNVYVSRSYPEEKREDWEDKVISRIANIQSLTVDIVDTETETRTINPHNIEYMQIIEDI